jgi:uncharacterized protein (DUF433 family)
MGTFSLDGTDWTANGSALDARMSADATPEKEASVTLERISIDPEVMNGQPCIRGTRLTVKRVLRILAEYRDRSEILKDYPRLDDEAIRDALLFAAASVEDRTEELSY